MLLNTHCGLFLKCFLTSSYKEKKSNPFHMRLYCFKALLKPCLSAIIYICLVALESYFQRNANIWHIIQVLNNCPEANCQFLYCLNGTCLVWGVLLLVCCFFFNKATRWSQNTGTLWVLIAATWWIWSCWLPAGSPASPAACKTRKCCLTQICCFKK